MKKVTTFKGFKIEQISENQFYLYTAEEWAYGKGLRQYEHETGSIEEAKEWIKCY